MLNTTKQQLFELFNNDKTDSFLKLLYDKYEEPISGGLADGCHPRDFNEEQLLKGIKVEFEHGKHNVLRATKISMDHLREIRDYYDRLSAMEMQAEKEGVKNDDEDIIDNIKSSVQKVSDLIND